jgi:hypothetical protein
MDPAGNATVVDAASHSSSSSSSSSSSAGDGDNDDGNDDRGSSAGGDASGGMLGDLGRLVGASRGLLLMPCKEPLWEKALESTEATDVRKFDLKLSRSRAANFAAKGLPDVAGRFMTFSQAFRQMDGMQVKFMRRSVNVYNCILMGEYAQVKRRVPHGSFPMPF